MPQSRRPKVRSREEWSSPLLRVLEGHENLLKVTSEFPKLGKLPALGKLPRLVRLPAGGEIDPVAVSPIVVVVVVVAVAARPGAVPSRELLQAKLLDVYGPEERAALRDAAELVSQNPKLVKEALGIGVEQLGENFMGRLEQVRAAL